MSDTIILEVARFHPERDTELSYESFEVPLRADWMVLDGLNHIKDQLDGSLAFRWSCRMGICGSCGMMVNGVPKLTCETLLMNFAPGPVRIGPLDHFPVVKDLVIEMDEFMGKLQKVRPWIVRKDDYVPKREFIQTPQQLGAFQQFTLCINCMLCYAACPVYGMNNEFLGPAAIALARRYNLDSRDEGSEERVKVLAASEGIWECSFVGECSAACPKGVDPAKAIQQTKFDTVNGFVMGAMLMPFGKRR